MTSSLEINLNKQGDMILENTRVVFVTRFTLDIGAQDMALGHYCEKVIHI